MKKLISVLLCLMLLVGALSVTALAEEEAAPFTVSGAINDYMVLQRDAEVKIWGWSDNKGAKITVTFKGNTVEGTVDDKGEWLVKLPKMEADTTENDLVITMGDHSEVITGVLVGDVYLVGGQSNAEKTLSACGSIYSSKEIKAWVEEAGGNIRYFNQGRSDAMVKNGIYMSEPQKDTLPGKKWKKENTSAARSYSAIGFFFAHKLYKETGVPIGMVSVASSGSPVSQLMSKEASLAANYTRFENNIPVSGMFNALMNPFINMSIKGMIFYQGESENWLAQTDYGKYNTYVNYYVEDLRMKMNQDFPFYYVQLSSHVLDQWAGIAEQRAVQFDGLSVIKNSGMVVSMDQGFRPEKESDFAHPNNKKPVGERLADLALSREYGIGDESYVTSPMPIYAYKADDGVVIKFKNVGDGLKKIGQHDKLYGFKAIGADGKYVDVEATIIGKDEVKIDAKYMMDTIKGVAYGVELLAFVDYPEGSTKYVANLGNSNELPAPTFKLQSIYASVNDVPGNDASNDGDGATDATPLPDGTTPAPQVTPLPDGTTPAPEKKTNGNTVTIIAIVGGAVLVGAVIIVVALVASKKGKKEN